MIKKLFGKADEDQYIELDMTEEKGDERVVIQVERLEAFADSERILNKLRGGSIILTKIKHLRDKDDAEFKRSMEKIKKVCMNIGGEIGALGTDWILLAPSFAKIHKAAA